MDFMAEVRLSGLSESGVAADYFESLVQTLVQTSQFVSAFRFRAAPRSRVILGPRRPPALAQVAMMLHDI